MRKKTGENLRLRCEKGKLTLRHRVFQRPVRREEIWKEGILKREAERQVLAMEPSEVNSNAVVINASFPLEACEIIDPPELEQSNLFKCPDCGKMISRNAVFCPNCGRVTQQPSRQQEAQKCVVEEIPPSIKHVPNANNTLAGYVVALIIAIGIFVFLVLLPFS
jgi:hypothetical protein